MRLLEILPNDTLRLTEDLYTDLPPYAILSHTWGHDKDEVTYKDLSKGRGKEKLGYKKLEFCQEWTQDHGLRHFWVDTCCIDKRNLAEISEAINSMYRWYEDSEICFAYLADVPHETQEKVLDEKAFRNSRWFTRGWTLQELIAPSIVKFYSSEGLNLGDTRSLMPLVVSTTKIPSTVLWGSKGKKLSGCSAEQRISWFSGRQTKRPEDSIYCLLGLLGVSMPLLYGEGIANAARRLGREIAEMELDENRQADSTSGLVKALLQFSIKRPDGSGEPPVTSGVRRQSYKPTQPGRSAEERSTIDRPVGRQESRPTRHVRSGIARVDSQPSNSERMMEEYMRDRSSAEARERQSLEARRLDWDRLKPDALGRTSVPVPGSMPENTPLSSIDDRLPVGLPPPSRRGWRLPSAEVNSSEYATVSDWLSDVYNKHNTLPASQYLENIHNVRTVVPQIVPERPQAPVTFADGVHGAEDDSDERGEQEEVSTPGLSNNTLLPSFGRFVDGEL